MSIGFHLATHENSGSEEIAIIKEKRLLDTWLVDYSVIEQKRASSIKVLLYHPKPKLLALRSLL
jgi:hypothetical protein